MVAAPRLALLFAVLSLYACSPQAVQPRTPSGALCRTEAHFSRRDGTAESVIEALNGAEKTIRVAMYGLTHTGIVDALVAAKWRGVDVALKTDKTESARFVALRDDKNPQEVVRETER